MKRRSFVLGMLAESNPAYDEMCRAVIEAFPGDPKRLSSPRAAISWPERYFAKVKAIRAVRDVLWDELAVIERDETLWLTSAGWAKLRESGKGSNTRSAGIP